MQHKDCSEGVVLSVVVVHKTLVFGLREYTRISTGQCQRDVGGVNWNKTIIIIAYIYTGFVTQCISTVYGLWVGYDIAIGAEY